MRNQAEEILLKHWGYSAFRAGQLDIVTQIMSGTDTLALLPTGGGKSICFQVPAVALSGTTLVVSPLIALMKDQVETLNRKGIPAAALHAGMSRSDINQTLERALHGQYKLLYVSPERLATQNFRGYLPNLNVGLLVVDEAHCISMWGQDFRPSYQRLCELRSLLPSVPVAAFTASAPAWIQDDILQGLQLRNPYVHKGDFSRNNLVFHALKSQDKALHIVRILQRSQGSALVFAHTRKSVEGLCATLKEQGISASFYHAGLSNSERSERQNAWVSNHVRVMVCTNAFGMGVDKPDVRLVIHSYPPKNPEDYYQEAGRAGRDGQTSHCVLLYHPNDWLEIHQNLRQQHPMEDTLKQAYHGLLNTLGISDGEGEFQPLPVNLSAIAQQLKTNPKDLYYAVKALEILGQWQWIEGQWQPAKVMMTGNADDIYAFKEAQPTYGVLLDVLLRGHGGIFDHPIAIQEAHLAKRLRKGDFERDASPEEIQQVQRMLQQMATLKLLRYQPATEWPILMLNEPRSLYPSLNMGLLQRLLQRRMEALQQLESYATGQVCRSTFWKTYFTNDTPDRDCGTCDICKRRNRIAGDVKSRQFWQTTLQSQPQANATQLLKQFPLTQQGILVQTLRILLDEGCIIENENQALTWVGESFLQ